MCSSTRRRPRENVLTQSSIADLLAAGDVRERSGAIATEIMRHNERFAELIDAMLADDAHIAAGAAAVADSITRIRPDLLVPFRARIIDEAGPIETPGVRTRVALMVPRVKLDPKERSRAVALFDGYLKSENDDVAVAGLTALGDMATDDHTLRKRVLHIVERYSKTGSAAMQARAQKILTRFQAKAGNAPSSKPRSDESRATRRGPSSR